MLVEFVFDVGEGEFGAPDGNVEFRKNPGKSADVILVSVSEDNPANSLAILD